MPGPLPQPTRRRRNAPTIPTTALPKAGRPGRAPGVPAGYVLGKQGRAWWAWAWKTPQACAWDAGAIYGVARRAQLEDDVAALADVRGLDALDALGADAAREFKFLIQRLSALATSKVALLKEMRELDDRLGLSPKSMAALRWSLDEPDGQDVPASGRHRHLQAVPKGSKPKADPRALLA